MILGIDPGPKESAYVILDNGKIVEHRTLPNGELLKWVDTWLDEDSGAVVIEWIEGYGMRVGQETFDTCRWTGRFEQAAGGAHLLGRKAISLHLCFVAQAGDKFVRQALIDRIGPPGTKKNPGPTYGIVGHEWSALSVALTWWDKHKEAVCDAK